MKRSNWKIVAAEVFLSAVAGSAIGSPTNYLERFSPDFSTNTAIIWRAPTNQLPKSLWIYKRLPPQPFLASVISNAVVLAGVQDRGFPTPSTNAFFIWSAFDPCGTAFSIFSIQPANTSISFTSTNHNSLTENMPDDGTVRRRAYECAARFGLDAAHLVACDVYTRSPAEGCSGTPTNGIYACGIHLARKLDGVNFLTLGRDDSSPEGFSLELGSRGQIRSFTLVWPNLQRDHADSIASPPEIVRCIRGQRVLVVPHEDEPDFFGRIKTLAGAKTFTVMKITPIYGEGVFGDAPANEEPPKVIAPFAELEAVADFGSSNMPVRLLSPILASEIVRQTTATDK
jgi:hypothetical protein